MEKELPDFAIFQNSRTKTSALWMKEIGEWQDYPRKDYGAILVMATMLRSSTEPERTLQHITKALVERGNLPE